MAAQRTRKTSTRAAETGGSNTLFTMGLVTVIALLIVGYVMTQGGFSQLTSEGDGELNLMDQFLGSNAEVPAQPIIEPTLVPQSGGIIVSNPMSPTTSDPGFESQNLDLLKKQYEQTLALRLKEKDDLMEKRIETIRLEHENEMRELKLKLEFLEMENERLRGE